MVERKTKTPEKLKHFVDLIPTLKNSNDVLRYLTDKENEFSSGLLGCSFRIDKILDILGRSKNWQEGLANLEIADIGCGSDATGWAGEKWPPYFARICAANGAKVIGVDIKWSALGKDELYKHIQTDALLPMINGELGKLLEVKSGTLDVINCSSLIDLIPNEVRFAEEYLGVTSKDLQSSFLKESLKLLKEDGVAALTADYYRKSNNKLVKV
jgi:SAM-dependent methyltransferase